MIGVMSSSCSRELKRNHLPVSGLSAKDFVLGEDGKLQNISHFTKDKVPLSIVFMIDLTQTVEPVRQSLASAAQEILSHLGDADEVAVAAFSSTGKVVVPFTTDRTKARAALEQASQMSSNEGTFLNEAVY
jgi:VWFA-related protein